MNIKSGGELMDVDMLLLDAKIVVCDSLDGSSNIDAAISSDSIFGIYNPNDKCNTDDCDYNSAVMNYSPFLPFTFHMATPTRYTVLGQKNEVV
ncbi:unnamed protein product [Brassica rapa]|uniref:Uncharacterized protein n=1 Tax=Brassica campestris TaxID=3711 RepID=A0A8D9LW71_BRACM|nr:unnamed protein product [Brassica rapa]